MSDLPDDCPLEEFNLQKHIELLGAKKNEAAEWSL
jgi:hypothetical protein